MKNGKLYILILSLATLFLYNACDNTLGTDPEVNKKLIDGEADTVKEERPEKYKPENVNALVSEFVYGDDEYLNEYWDLVNYINLYKFYVEIDTAGDDDYFWMELDIENVYPIYTPSQELVLTRISFGLDSIIIDPGKNLYGNIGSAYSCSCVIYDRVESQFDTVDIDSDYFQIRTEEDDENWNLYFHIDLSSYTYLKSHDLTMNFTVLKPLE